MKYFFDLEWQKQEMKNLRHLTDESDVEITNKIETLKELYNFYSKLYTSTHIKEKENFDQFIANAKLNPLDAQILDCPSLLLTVLADLPANKLQDLTV